MALSETVNTRGVLYRAVPVSVRSLDVANRRATFVASTENPVDTFWGREVLRMNGVDLTRFDGCGPFLDAHNGSSIDNVLGSGQANVVGRELEFVATFDTEGKGARAWGLVQRGHIRTVSIGYRIDPANVKRLKEGETDGQGESQVRGPANVVRKWELLEVSLVPVPADRDAVLRSALFSPEPAQRAAEALVADHKDQAAGATSDAGKPETKSLYEKAAGATPAPARAESANETRAREIRALAGERFAAQADVLVLEGKTVEEARAALLTLAVERSKPMGTPEPKNAAPATPKTMPAEVTDAVLVQSFRSNF